VVQTPEIDQSNFLAMLRSNCYEIRSKDLKQRPDGSSKGDWDMGLALDALAMSERLDVVALVTGDGDFVELVNFLKARGVRVEVYSFPYSTAEELRNAASEYFQMGTEIVMNPQRAAHHSYAHSSHGRSEQSSHHEQGSDRNHSAGGWQPFHDEQTDSATSEDDALDNENIDEALVTSATGGYGNEPHDTFER